VFDRNAASTVLAIAELSKKDLYDKLRKYALWRTSSTADADDLLADAIEWVCDPQRKPWDPAKGSFFRHMRLVMDTLAIEIARGGRARFEVVSSKLAFNEKTPDVATSADDALHDARTLAWLRRLGQRLLAKIGDKDPLATKVFIAACEGAEEPHEQAAKIGCSVEEVREAQRRLRYQGAGVKAQDQQEEAARMNALREEAKKKGTK